MDFSDYIDPVELEKPEQHYLHSDDLFPRTITINTASFEIGDLSQYDTAILGLPEERNSFNKGTALAPDNIRGELYRLISPVNKLKIIDLGNLKSGNTYTDSYFALKEIVYQLLCNNVTIILLGGSQDLTLPAFQAFENFQEKINLVTVDSKIDSHKESLTSNSDSYLLELLLKKRKLFKFVNIGHQAYLTEKNSLDIVNKLFHEAIRLGQVRSDIKMIEPILRDSDIVSFDVGAIRQSDAPGHFRHTPNGFYSEEGCQISRYAGISDRLRLFGVFETNSRLDQNNHTAALVAQMIWHFIDGLEYRNIESPEGENSNFKTFIVGHTDLDYDMTFFKSMVTERWWLEVPDVKNNSSVIIACSDNDYQVACNHEVPDIWWKTYQKLN